MFKTHVTYKSTLASLIVRITSADICYTLCTLRFIQTLSQTIFKILHVPIDRPVFIILKFAFLLKLENQFQHNRVRPSIKKTGHTSRRGYSSFLGQDNQDRCVAF